MKIKCSKYEPWVTTVFTLYINHLPKASSFKITTFAGDTLLTISSTNPQNLKTLAND